MDSVVLRGVLFLLSTKTVARSNVFFAGSLNSAESRVKYVTVYVSKLLATVPTSYEHSAQLSRIDCRLVYQ